MCRRVGVRSLDYRTEQSIRNHAYKKIRCSGVRFLDYRTVQSIQNYYYPKNSLSNHSHLLYSGAYQANIFYTFLLDFLWLNRLCSAYDACS